MCSKYDSPPWRLSSGDTSRWQEVNRVLEHSMMVQVRPGSLNTGLSLVIRPQYCLLIGHDWFVNTDLWLVQAAHIPNTDNDFQQFVLSNAR